MAVCDVSSDPSPQSLFRDYVLSNIKYWRNYVATRAADIKLLDRGHHRIVKAIVFALELEEAWPYIADLIETFSSYMERRGYWESWTQILSQALERAAATDHVANKVSLTALLGRVLQRQGRYREAAAYHRRTMRLARTIGDQFNEARACTNLGYLYIDGGYWWRSEVLCCHALDIFEAIANDHGRAHTENHLGILTLRQQRWPEAEHHLQQACQIWQGSGDDYGLMRGYINLGNLYDQMELFDQALIYHTKALDQADLVGEASEQGMTLINMSITQTKLGDTTLAEASLWQAEAIYKQLSNERGLALTWHGLGWLYLDQQKWPEAEHYLEAALTAARKLADGYLEIETLIGLVKYETAKHDKKKALLQLAALDQFIDQNPQYKTYRPTYAQLAQDCYNLPGGD